MFDNLRLVVSRVQPTQTSAHRCLAVFIPEDLRTLSHVFIRRGGMQPTLTTLYVGPYRVINRGESSFQSQSQAPIPKYQHRSPETSYPSRERQCSRPSVSPTPRSMSMTSFSLDRRMSSATQRPLPPNTNPSNANLPLSSNPLDFNP